jgi:hypothetical protein
LQIVKHFAARHVEERADDGCCLRQLANAGNSGQARQAGAAEDVEEDCFDVVVSRVSGSEVASTTLARRRGQKTVAGLPRGSFDSFAAAASRQIACRTAGDQLQVELIGQFFNKCLVGIRAGPAQPMIEVCQYESSFAASANFA